ncbi:hypothetical protein [Nannocystis pusilla]|uniref:hypothetical protein n=1 Tax=Nannocystis pusilla TaxID=889268 RepID=UPI003DA68ADD
MNANSMAGLVPAVSMIEAGPTTAKRWRNLLNALPASVKAGSGGTSCISANRSLVKSASWRPKPRISSPLNSAE